MKKIFALMAVSGAALLTGCAEEDLNDEIQKQQDKINEIEELNKTQQEKEQKEAEENKEEKKEEINEQEQIGQKNETVVKENIEEEKEEEITVEKEIKEKNEEKEEVKIVKETKPTGEYIVKKKYNSKVHIYITGQDETIDITIGEKGKMEKLRNLNLPNTVAKINAGLFDHTFEFGGMLFMDGKYIQQPWDRYSEIIKYKDGRIKIESFKQAEFDPEFIEENKDDIDFIIGGSYPLIKEGEINLGNASEYSHHNQRNPRSMFGQLRDGRYVLAVVEGRSLESAGVTAQQSAEIMKDLGAVEAINLDGGGSSTLFIENELKNNIPGAERSIGSAIMVVKK